MTGFRVRMILRTAAVMGLVCLLAANPSGAAEASKIRVRISQTSIPQGATAEIAFATPWSARGVTVRFAGRSWSVYPAGDRAWRTIVGTDPTTPPGSHPVEVSAIGPDGVRIAARQNVSVVRVEFRTRRLTFDPNKQALLRPELAEEERRKVAAALRILHPQPLWSGGFALPLQARVSSPYGVLSVYGGRVRGFHGGADFAADEGTPVRASAAGIVRLAEPLPLSGKAVLIDHGLGVVTSYLHLSAIEVRAGQRVARGDLVGRVGSSGLATGPHLHWGLRTNGARVDPLRWVEP